MKEQPETFEISKIVFEDYLTGKPATLSLKNDQKVTIDSGGNVYISSEDVNIQTRKIPELYVAALDADDERL